MNLNKFIKDIPVYKELFKDLLNSKFTVKDLAKLPILTKKHISKNFPENWMTNKLQKVVTNNEYEFMKTSGTTGEKLMLIRPKNWWYSIENRMFKYLNDIAHEYSDIHSKAILTTAICSNTICYTEAPHYEERIINGILHLNITPDPNKWAKVDIQRIVDEIDLFKPQCFQADSLYLAIFFKLLKKYKVKLPKHLPKCLILAYEYCPKKCLKIIKNFWDIPTYIIFGTTELGVLFYQCPNGHFHWMDDDNHLYFKPLKQKAHYYELLVTSFRNLYMPFINYNTHDLVYIDPKVKCSCDRHEIIVQQFMGRSRDVTYSKFNEIITTGDIDNLLAKLNNNILVYQLDFSYKNKIIFKFTTFNDKDLNMNQKNQIKKILEDLYGNKIIIEIQNEIEIKPAPSGKFEIIRKNNE